MTFVKRLTLYYPIRFDRCMHFTTFCGQSLFTPTVNSSNVVYTRHPSLHGRAFQEQALFEIETVEAVPGGEIGWLFPGHAQAIPGR